LYIAELTRKYTVMDSETGTLKKQLNLFDSVALVIGSMIGSGIFIVSADIARTVGSPGWLLVVWGITGLMTIVAALSYGELACMMPHAGGKYVYLREAYNPLVGFLYGWTLFTVIQTGLIAAVAMAFGKFLGILVPWFSEKHVLFEWGVVHIRHVHIAAIGSIVLLTWINTRGINTGKIIQNIFTYSKTLALAVIILVGLVIAPNAEAIAFNSQHFWDAASFSHGQWLPLQGWALWVAVGTAMVGSLFSADAWYSLTFTSGEVINPKRNIPLGMVIGTSIVILIYILVNIVYLKFLPVRGDISSPDVLRQGISAAINDRVGASVMYVLMGSFAAVGMALLVVISTFGCNNGLILAGARVYYAMAKDKLFFQKAGELNARRVPQFGLVIQAVWASLLCLTGTYSNLLDYVVFAVLVFFALTISGLFVLRVKKPHAERPYKAFAYPVLPALYIVAAVFIMIILLIYKPLYTWPGLVIVLLGIPVYYMWKIKNPTKFV